MPDIRFHPISTLLLGLALLGLGCGDGNDGGSSTGVPIENMPTEYAAAYCSWLYRCCPSAQLAHLADAPLAFTGNSEAECRTNYQALATLVLPTLTAAEGAGRVRYDPQGAKSCFDMLKSSCSPAAICTTMVEPLVATGGACAQDNECQDGVCLGETSGADGSCGSHRALGEACEEASDCSAGACTANKCTERAAAGSLCLADQTCASDYCDYQTRACATAPYSGACSPGS